MRALVTGGTGLVGSHIIERLTADGWNVRAMLRDNVDRPPDERAWLDSSGVETVAGDVLDADSFTRAAGSCDVIFHTAAAITPRGGWEAFRSVNVDGTRNAITAAERSGARLLQLSSVAVYGAGARYRATDEKTDEDTPFARISSRSWYARSKRESDEMVMQAHREGRIWATAVRPCVIYGRRDRQFVPRIARLLRFGVAPVVGGGRSILAVVHAANVADGAVLAATAASAGGRAYNLANDFDVSVAEFLRLGAEGLGRRLRLVNVPEPLARGAFVGARRLMKLLSGGRLSLVSTTSLDFVTRDNPFTSERAKRELGWAPRGSPPERIPDAFRWSASHRP